MKIQVAREACCSQDDQLGPLEAVYELNADATLADFVRAVTSSKFLQYSSSHTTLTGVTGGAPVVRIYSEYYLPGRLPEYAVPATTPLAALLDKQHVQFRFDTPGARRDA